MRVVLHTYLVWMSFQIVPRRQRVRSLTFTETFILKTLRCAKQRLGLSPLDL